MQASRIAWWSGKASIGIGGLWMLWTLAPWAGALLVVALVLALVGLVALPLRQDSETRIVAWAGYLVSAVSIVLALIGYSSVMMAPPSGAVPLLFLLGLGNLCLGLLLLGFASLQGQALPRGRILPFALAVLLALQTIWGWVFVWNTPFPSLSTVVVWLILGICLGSAWIALGLMLNMEARAASAKPLSSR
jgi:hypothetical protein